MNFSFKKRFFIRGPAKHKTSVSLTEPMFEALKMIAEQTGESVPEVITEALEQYLTHLANSNLIPFPKETREEKEEAS